MKNLVNYGCEFYALSPNVLIKNKLDKINTYQVGTFPLSEQTFERYFGPIKFSLASFNKSLSILKKFHINLIHHILPFNPSPINFELLSVLLHFHPFIIGPASLEWSEVGPEAGDKENITILKPLRKVLDWVYWPSLHFLKLHEKTVNNCDALVVTTEKLKKIYENNIPAQKIKVVPFGVDIQFFKPIKKEQSNGSHEVLVVSKLIKAKGIEYAINAMAYVLKEMPNCKLRIVGSGPDKNRLEILVKKLKISDKVIFEGNVLHDKIFNFYQNCDCLCHPAIGDPFPQSPLEAMACGKPVVAFNAGGLSEQINNGKNGFLAPLRDVDLLANSLIKILTDRTLRNKMGKEARKVTEEKFAWEIVSSKIFEIYKNFLF